MKTKILLFGWESFLHEMMLERELKHLAKAYDIVLVNTLDEALHAIAKANFEEKNPVTGLVINRTTLTVYHKQCRNVSKFMERYAKKYPIAINMIHNDQDSDARDYAVSAYYCTTDDWEQIKNIFDHNIKK